MKILKLIKFSLVIVLVVVIWQMFISKTVSMDQAGLKATIDRQYELNKKGVKGHEEICKSYIFSEKPGYVEECLKTDLDYDQNKNSKFTVHDIRVDGSEGYVDRTMSTCADVGCNQVLQTTRQARRYVYRDGRWLMDIDKFLCARSKPYEMSPEFSRALSLITQRIKTVFNGSAVDEIINCLDIQYAADQAADMQNAEAYFAFRPEQSSEHLQIVVSPKYQVQDDLLTAILLSHEVVHAFNYSMNDLYLGKPADCYDDEVTAFYYQANFLYSLNKGERETLLARYSNDRSGDFSSVIDRIISFVGKDGKFDEKYAKKLLMADPFYQKQCGSR